MCLPAFFGNEQPLDILNLLCGRSTNNLDYFCKHGAAICACYQPGTICHALSAILGAPLEMVDPRFLEPAERSMIQLAHEGTEDEELENFNAFKDLDHNGKPPEDNNNGNCAMDEDSEEEEGEEEVAKGDDFIVEDGDEDEDDNASYEYYDDDDEDN